MRKRVVYPFSGNTPKLEVIEDSIETSIENDLVSNGITNQIQLCIPVTSDNQTSFTSPNKLALLSDVNGNKYVTDETGTIIKVTEVNDTSFNIDLNEYTPIAGSMLIVNVIG